MKKMTDQQREKAISLISKCCAYYRRMIRCGQDMLDQIPCCDKTGINNLSQNIRDMKILVSKQKVILKSHFISGNSTDSLIKDFFNLRESYEAKWKSVGELLSSVS